MTALVSVTEITREQKEARLKGLKQSLKYLDEARIYLDGVHSGFIENNVDRLAAEMLRTVQHYTYILKEEVETKVAKLERELK